MRGKRPKENNNRPRESNIPEWDCVGGNHPQENVAEPRHHVKVQFQRRGIYGALLLRMQV
jgi:hypothetical protein